MDRKEFRVSLKDATISDEGKGQIVFATMGVIDKDGDITDAGAFGNQLAHLLPMHIWKEADTPFLGIARIHESGNEAVADIELNMELQRAKDWRSSLKFALDRGKDIEWSYGFNVDKYEYRTVNGVKARALLKLTVIEVSPVVVGAGENTRTLDIKSKETPEGDIPTVKTNAPAAAATTAATATTDQPGAAKAAPVVASTAAAAPAAATEQKETKAYVQIAGSWEQTQARLVEAAQDLYRYERDYFCCLEATTPATCIISVYSYDSASSGYEYYQYDWTQDADGKITLANEREIELEAVVQQKSIRFSDDHSNLLKVNREFLTRSKALAALRVKEGRSLSRANRDRITSALEQVRGIATDMEALLAETDTDAAKAAAVTPDTPTVNLDSLYAESLKVLSQIQGHLPLSQ